MNQPLISCIMPTRNRREFVPGALRCWDAQTWANKELVVIDTSDEPIQDLLPRNDKRIRYVRIQPATEFNTGAVRNIACGLANGEFIAHFDDDDWSHPHRLREQWKSLAQSGRGVSGYRSILFADEAERRAWCFRGAEAASSALGTSLFYARPFWRHHPFRPLLMGEDGEFVRTAVEHNSLISVDGFYRCIARVHAGNTSPKFTDDEQWTEIHDAREMDRIINTLNE